MGYVYVFLTKPFSDRKLLPVRLRNDCQLPVRVRPHRELHDGRAHAQAGGAAGVGGYGGAEEGGGLAEA